MNDAFTPAAPQPASRQLLPSFLAQRLDVLRRDLRAVAADFLGERPPPFWPRMPLARHMLAAPVPGESALLGARPLRVARVVRETPDAISLHLVDPEGRRIAFVPGQFFTLLVAVPGGEPLRRAYSICTAPDEDGAALEVAVTIKRVQDGRASNFLNDNAREGDLVKVLGPSGSFTVTPDPAARRHLVLVAGGSGITPLMSIARAVLAREPHSFVSLVYGNRGEADIIFREALASLAAAHPDRFALLHALSEPPARFSGIVGQLDRDNVSRALDALPARGDLPIDFYICGPEPMMAAAREALLARGVAPTSVHEERFSSPARRAAPTRPTAPQPVTVRIGGKTNSLIARPGQTLLEAGVAASVPMPFSCTMGGCGACKVRLVRGDVTSEEPNCLQREERAEGFILACVSRATSPCEVEVP